LHESPCSVGILVDHNFRSATNILVYYPESPNKLFTATIRNLIQNTDIKSITIVNQDTPAQPADISDAWNSKIKLVNSTGLEQQETVIESFDLIIVHVDDWKDTVIRKMMSFEKLPSVLILKSRE